MLTRFVEWFFRDRRTGHLTVAQWPNLPLWVFVAASLVDWAAGPAGRLATGARIVAVVALVIWAGDEVLRGANPWRRCLGGAVLLGCVVRLLA